MPTRLTVRQVMESNPVVVPPDRPVGELLRLMNERRIGSVLVCEPDGRLRGIFTERDLLRRVADAIPGWREYPVADWMTRDPHTIGPDAGWDEAMTAMTARRVRRLPVVDGGRVVGILSTNMLIDRRADYLNQQVDERTRALKQANDQLMARDVEVLYNLRAAGRLQMKLLPQSPPAWPEFHWAVHFAPLDHLGGDYYDFAEPTPDHLGFLIADASGHSVPAAMVAVLTRFAFADVSRRTTSPGAVLAALNQRLQGITEERFVTAFYGVFDRRSRVLRYANAGHPHPLLLQAAAGTVKPLAAQGFLLGIVPDEVYAEKEVTLAPGDAICFFTDGLVEARNEIGELFGEQRLTDCLRAGEADTHLLARVLDAQRQFCSGVPLGDDLTVAVCRLPES
jgi:serine phosphatase RsbU (regulator of sigma subunit)/CBS domain-containing protein